MYITTRAKDCIVSYPIDYAECLLFVPYQLDIYLLGKGVRSSSFDFSLCSSSSFFCNEPALLGELCIVCGFCTLNEMIIRFFSTLFLVSLL